MKVVYINPNINHHKLPFYDALRNIYGQDNVIYATPLIHEENRIKMGFDSYQQENWLYHIQPSNSIFQNDGLRKGLGNFVYCILKFSILYTNLENYLLIRISSIWHKESMPHMILIIWVFVRIAFSVSDILHLSIKQLEVTICFQKRKLTYYGAEGC